MDSECSTVSANGVTTNGISNGLCDPIPSVRTSASDDATALSFDKRHQSDCDSSLPCSSPATTVTFTIDDREEDDHTFTVDDCKQDDHTFTIDDCEQDDHTFTVDDCEENGPPDGTATVKEIDIISPVVSTPDTPNSLSAQLVQAQLGLKDPVSMMYVITSCAQC